MTEQLSDQGRVLVPGLTMGVLGQDYIGGEAGPMPVNSTYAQTLEISSASPASCTSWPYPVATLYWWRDWCADYACGCCLIGG